MAGDGMNTSAAAAAVAASPAPRLRAASAADRAVFARALQAAQRRCGNDGGDAEHEAPCREGDGATIAARSAITGLASTPPPRDLLPPMSTSPAGLTRSGRLGGAQLDAAAHESPTTIEWRTPLLPSGRLTLSRAEGGAWTLCCTPADLAALRGAVTQLADRFEQRALGLLRVRVE